MCAQNTILRSVFGFLAPKPAYSQGVTSYTQTQQTRQVTVIKPAAPSQASSTFSIYPVTSTVQPVAAAASVVPTYSQSPTYSTNAVTYSGELLNTTWLIILPVHHHFIFFFLFVFDLFIHFSHVFQEHLIQAMKQQFTRLPPATISSSSSSNRNKLWQLLQLLQPGQETLSPRKPPFRTKRFALSSLPNLLRSITAMSARSAVLAHRWVHFIPSSR